MHNIDRKIEEVEGYEDLLSFRNLVMKLVNK